MEARQHGARRAGAEVAGVELVGDTDLGRGKGRRMERGRDGRREFGSELVSA
jgi:hypothetical protein